MEGRNRIVEVSYRKNLNKSYMCVETKRQVLEAYELQMLEHCRIAELLHMQVMSSDQNSRYLYDISGKQQISDYLSGQKMGCAMLKKWLFSIQKVCAALPEYLLRESGICLEWEFIYINLEDGSFQYTYLPFYEKNLPEAFRGCMEQLLRKIDHQDHEAVELGYQIYQLCIQDHASIRKILETVLSGQNSVKEKEFMQSWNQEAQEHRGGKSEKNDRQESNNPQPESEDRKFFMDWKETLRSFSEHIEKYFSGFLKPHKDFSKEGRKKERLFSQKREFCPKGKKWTQKESAKEQRNLAYQVSDAEEPAVAHPTELLAVQESILIGKLEYQGVHKCEDIFIEGESFLLGKNESQVDGVILADGVSRLHARIIRQEQRYFIEDLNSTNGTFLNDTELEYHQPQELSKNDRVRFGVEEYVFI
ncbi:MAG: FHA domain-containing protein [Lachnospiraceae bacterium]|nr:FHA domain-containing protein [Lachnospiraceae bacterium]